MVVVLVIAILLLVVGVIGLILGSVMYGDIGIAAMIGAITSILSGIGFILQNKSNKRG